jgi:hypothetical protein
MSNFNKKFFRVLFFCILLVVGGAFLVLFSAGVADTNVVPEQSKIIHEWEIGMENVLEKIGLKLVGGDLEFLAPDEIYAEDYGGVYIDDDGQLIVLLVDNSRSYNNVVRNSSLSECFFESRNRVQRVKIKGVKFSEDELLRVNSYLVKEMVSLGINTISVRTDTNTLLIGIVGEKELAELEKEIITTVSRDCYIKDKDVTEMLSFECLNPEDIPTMMVAVSSGSKIGGEAGGGFFPLFSVGYPKGDGFITCAHHGLPVGTKIQVDSSAGTIIGTIKSSKFDGVEDASFVKFDSGHSFSTPIPYMNSTNYPIKGASISHKGYNGTYSGVVDDLYYTFKDTSGRTWTDLLRSTAKVVSGDSGGLTYDDRHVGTSIRYVFGIISSSSTSGSYTNTVKYGNITVS